MASLLNTSVKKASPLNSNTVGVAEEKEQPAFVTLQSLASFTGAAVAVTVVWKFFDRALDIDGRGVPIAASFAIGLLLWAQAAFRRPRPTWGYRGTQLVIALINSMYLYLSVIGIDLGADQIGGIEQTGPGAFLWF
jgi:hypothetical protein